MNRGSIFQLQVNYPELVAPPLSPPDPEQYRITAVHESSHVAAYLTYGLKFRRAVVFIADNGAVEGAVRVDLGANGHYGSTKRAIVCLAGCVGEAKYSDVNLSDVLASNVARVDVEMAMAALQSDPRAPPFSVVLQAAQRLVEQQWLRIERLAAELGRHGELSYEECCRIVKRR